MKRDTTIWELTYQFGYYGKKTRSFVDVTIYVETEVPGMDEGERLFKENVETAHDELSGQFSNYMKWRPTSKGKGSKETLTGGARRVEEMGETWISDIRSDAR